MSDRGLRFVVEREAVSIIEAWSPPGVRIAGPHFHREHSDSFYVLEGEITLELGPEKEPATVTAGNLFAVPPGVVHGFRTSGDRPARWLTIHTPDGGFAEFMHGRLDGVEVDWDIVAAP